MFRYTKTALVAAILASTSVAGYATNVSSLGYNVLSISKEKISFTQAIKVSEHHVSGKAVQPAQAGQCVNGEAYLGT